MGFNARLFNRIFSKRKPERKLIGYVEGWISVVGNLVLFVFKFLCGVYLNSISLIADAFHSLSDVLTSVVVILGFKFGGRPADKEHPFGHGRIEQIATIIIAFLLLIVAYDVGRSALDRILKPQKVGFNIIVFLLLILSAIFKEWMARFSIFLGKKIDSSSLIADAWHHRSDAIATALVALGLITTRFGFYVLDGIMGMGVAVLIAWVGVELIKNSASFLIGEAPSNELVEKIKSIALSIPGVLNLHDITVHNYQSNIVITLHIEVEDNISAKEAHEIALKVQDSIKQNIEDSQVIVHIDPKGERED